MILARGFFLCLGLFIFTASIGQNAAPSFALHNTLTISVRQQACIDVITQDKDASDTVRLRFLGGSVPGQWVTNSGSVKLASGVLCVTPTDQDAGSLWSFVFMAHDGVDSTLDTFYVNVEGYPARHALSQQEVGCGSWRFEMAFNAWTTQVTVYLRDENNTNVYIKGFSDVTGLIRDSVSVAAGKYKVITQVEDKMPNIRSYVDSITISRGIKVGVEGSSQVKHGETVYLKGVILAGEIPLKTYWVVEQNGYTQTLFQDTAYLAYPQYQNTTYRFIAQGRDLCLYEGSKMVESIDALGIRSQHVSSLKLYPNPAQNKVWIETNVESGILSLYDSKGMEVLTQSFANLLVPELNLASLPAGIYFVKLQDQSGQAWSGKVIKE